MFNKVLRCSGRIAKMVVDSSQGLVPRADPQSSRRILVSSNCQTGGIAAALQTIFPNERIDPIPLPTFSATEDEQAFAKKLGHADAWVSIGHYDLVEKYGLADRLQLVRIPRIRFTGFHPDLVYARKRSTNELIDPHYNSAIAVWAYKKRLDAVTAASLFSARNFARLGYLDQWGRSVKQQRQLFDGCDLDFSEFFLGAQREGVFMHSINHPKAQVLTRLAKLISLRLGMGKEVLDRHIEINDGLNEVVWPIYPEIGEALALYGAYEWKMGTGKWVYGVESFMQQAFDNYSRLQISPDDIVAVQVDELLFDEVLGTQAGTIND
jgi:hypothetical protein